MVALPGTQLSPQQQSASDDERAKSLEAGSTSTLSGSGSVTPSSERGPGDDSNTAGGGGLQELEKQETAFSKHSARAFPDGGLQAWLCVLGGFCCLFCSFGSHPHPARPAGGS